MQADSAIPDAAPDTDGEFAAALALYRQGDSDAVLACVEAAETAGKATADLYNLGGVVAKRSGQRSLAEGYYRQTLAMQPEHTGALNNLAILLQENDKRDEARALYEQAMAIAPDDVLPRLNLGNLQLAAGEHDAAEASYRSVVDRRPDLPEGWRSLAELHVARGERPAARECLRKATDCRANYFDAWLRMGDLWREDKHLPEAQACYQRLVDARPDDPVALNRLGETLQSLGRRKPAEALYRRALAVNPDDADVLNNLGILLHERKIYDESESLYRRALAVRPDFAEVWNNLAVLVQKLKRFDEAEECYRKALAIDPDYAAARCNYGLLCLTLGRFADGWPLYEARYAPGRSVELPKISRPQWQGEPLQGKRILIWSEQGLGDEIQFARYAQVLKLRGASRVGLVCKKPLARLFSSLEGVDTLHEEEKRFSVKEYDYWTLPLTIPRYLLPTPEDIPAAPAYLRPDTQLVAHWGTRLAPGRKVGLVWRGRAEYSNDSNRSLPDLRLLAPLWTLPDVTFYSLQKGEGEDEATRPPPGQPMVSLGGQLEDFADTAAVVSQLDLVISVDTAVAHLCGALGIPCWVMLPYVGTDWRWLLGRDDSPWYPSLRLFRQPAPDAWGPVVAQVHAALTERWAGPAAATGDMERLGAKLRRLSSVDRTLVEDLIDRLSGDGPA